MANCIDCLHFDICQFNEQEQAVINLKPSYRDISNDIADGCKFFKNKVDFVVMKKAKWIYETRYYSCSFCGGKRFNLLLGTDAEYCSYCGAKMIFEKEGADNDS